MKLLVALLFALLAAVAFAAAPIPAQVLRVIDGDTLQIDASIWVQIGDQSLRMASPVNVRLIGVDTPEIRAKTSCEREKAQKARDFVVQWVGDGGDIKVIVVKLDTYTGRVDGLILKADRNLAEDLISAGLGRPYAGILPRSSLGPWC